MLTNTEVPISYQITTAISAIGAMLKRNIWVDQHSVPEEGWNVYPNQSIMLVGPSGVGKDTAINFVTKLIEKWNIIPVIGGRTVENVFHRLIAIGDPAAAYIPAGEMTAFFGNKDYQNSMVQDFTDLLSTNEKKDVSTKTDLILTGPKVIKRPTLTMHCGSTVEWLHKAMPDGALEGGFIGRFLVVIEELGRKHVPLPKYMSLDADDKERLKLASKAWGKAIERILARTEKPQEYVLLEDAQFLYENWYCNRFKRFSKATFPYANRCRDMVLRLAMLCAVTREKFGWIEERDVQFGIEILDEVTKRIDHVVLPPTKEAQAAEDLLGMLPCGRKDILKALGRKYELRILKAAEELLLSAGRMEIKGGELRKVI